MCRQCAGAGDFVTVTSVRRWCRSPGIVRHGRHRPEKRSGRRCHGTTEDWRRLGGPVSITGSFSLGRYEVTRGQYAAFVSATGRAAGPSCWSLGPDGKWRDRHGMSCLAPASRKPTPTPWSAFPGTTRKPMCEWLSTTTGKIPVAVGSGIELRRRAGSSTSRYWGDDRDQTCRFANLSDRTAAQLLNWGADPEETFQCSDEHVYTAPVRQVSGECLWPARHAGQCLGVGRGLWERRLRGGARDAGRAPHGQLQPSRGTWWWMVCRPSRGAGRGSRHRSC